jgi:hypothetical protein
MNVSDRSNSPVFYCYSSKRKKNHVAFAPSIPKLNASVSSHLSYAGNKSVASDDGTFCTLPRRQYTERKLLDYPFDYSVQRTPKKHCNEFDRLKKLVRSHSSESDDFSNDERLPVCTTFDSPVKRSKVKKGTNTTGGLNDITVNFSDSFSIESPIKSPRSVVMTEIFSHDLNLDDENIEHLIFGTSDNSQNVAKNDDIANSDGRSVVQRYSSSSDLESVGENSSLEDDGSVSENDNVIEDEGLVWRRIIKDLKSIQNYHWKRVAAQRRSDSNATLAQRELHRTASVPIENTRFAASPPCIKCSAATVSKRHQTLEAHFHSNTSIDQSSPGLTRSTFTGSSKYSTSSTPPSNDSVDEQHQAVSASKHDRRVNAHCQNNKMSYILNTSNSALTTSTYAGSSIYSIESSRGNDYEGKERRDITVVDPHRTYCTIVRRLSILLIQNEKKWTADKDIASMVRKYLLRAYVR